ncbi:ABC transporter ATP-binding protein [Bosea sp. ANAM02]|uniref:ABC transporter ATP-binding protein n=1 Tax=Bosea sp. ANAM02 TaxID=2020412 RepID=UPI00140F32FB|nr:ABC transporter ATP-binding protein [Bosea sp. ANAM02]BCB21368.1 ABC transporter ATP-binding protein [Bosea sp. ANAM02]
MTAAPKRMDAHVSVRNVSKTFSLAELGRGPMSLREALRTGERVTTLREVRALQEVSLEIREGERIGIIGRNGAGKTTLLSMLAGITDPTAGQIEITGDVHAMLTIGAVLRDEATGRENIYLDGAVHGKNRDEIEAHVEEVIAFSELGEFIDRPVRTYSSGMKARLAFSMGAFIEPDVLIIDETLSVGDAFFAAKAARRMKEITAQGRIVIVVSHALGVIDEICSRCLWLDQGRLVMDGPAREVTKAYEKAVAQADEAELVAKFGRGTASVRRAEAGGLTDVRLDQDGMAITASARALVPLRLSASGRLTLAEGAGDLCLSILRVDGRRILERRLSPDAARLPATGPFDLSVTFEPMILGAGLYRFELTLLDERGPIDAIHRVIEIVDEEGQFGGAPLLLYPPVITATPKGDIS